ncbi:protein arginine kinase [Proteinivorax hydrogeniformans]|uniref:Protein-arginine kinase n=1 Tax=Proteinivorax hydrogeniformans TaxID=1826727 RepID=A0AAU8HTM9_9FIRM
MSLKGFIDKNLSRWIQEQEGKTSEVVLSSRIRLARNLNDIPFPFLADSTDQSKVVELVRDAMEGQKDFSYLSRKNLSLEDRQALMEKHLISMQLVNDNKDSGLWLNKDESASIMVNEEDHIRIQVLLPGFELEEARKKADELDDALEQKLNYGFNEEKGYLTSCPTNVGTGLRASVMVHLPGLVLTKQINKVLTAVSQLGLAVRGIYGEGSEAAGNILQISNQITLGQREEEIIDNIKRVTKQIIDHEHNARKWLLNEKKIEIKDKVHRAYGVLSNAYTISSKEALELLSQVKLGIDLQLLDKESSQIFKELIVLIRPGYLQKLYGQKLSEKQRDIKRAEVIRERLRN